jgi:uncharacterized protein YcaQ
VKSAKNKIYKLLGFTLCALLYALCSPADAQQPKKVHRIGYLSPFDPARESTRAEAIRLALRKLGYIEEQNIAIEYRYGEGRGNENRVAQFASELVSLKVDIIVVAGGAPVMGRSRRAGDLPRPA